MKAGMRLVPVPMRSCSHWLPSVPLLMALLRLSVSRMVAGVLLLLPLSVTCCLSCQQRVRFSQAVVPSSSSCQQLPILIPPLRFPFTAMLRPVASGNVSFQLDALCVKLILLFPILPRKSRPYTVSVFTLGLSVMVTFGVKT